MIKDINTVVLHAAGVAMETVSAERHFRIRICSPAVTAITVNITSEPSSPTDGGKAQSSASQSLTSPAPITLPWKKNQKDRQQQAGHEDSRRSGCVSHKPGKEQRPGHPVRNFPMPVIMDRGQDGQQQQDKRKPHAGILPKSEGCKP